MSNPSVEIERVLESRAALIDKELGLLSYIIEPPELAEVVTYALSQKGKKMRATMLTLACEAVGGNLSQAVVPAVVVEMVHNTSLVLDDIIDSAETRRSKPTINHKWGNQMALIACDALLALAIKQASKSNANVTSAIIECTATSMMSLAEGEAMELVQKSFGIDDYYRIAERKTASLFMASAEVGGLVGGGSKKEIEALRQYGKCLGIAFQIKDDILDVTSDNEALGKPTMIDLKMDRPTIVMLLANQNGLSRQDMLKMDRDELRKALQPAVEQAQKVAQDRITEAGKHLRAIKDGVAKERLMALGDYVLARKK